LQIREFAGGAGHDCLCTAASTSRAGADAQLTARALPQPPR